MALGLAEKEAIVAEVHSAANVALSAALADYRGLTVEEMTALRRDARESGVYLKVVRNTLLKRAVVGTEFECLAEEAAGPSMLAFAHDDPGAAARLFQRTAQELEEFDVKVLAIGGQLVPAEEIERVATLPTREEALAMLMSVMQAPAAKLVRTMNAIPSKLVRTLAAVGEQRREEAGD